MSQGCDHAHDDFHACLAYSKHSVSAGSTGAAVLVPSAGRRGAPGRGDSTCSVGVAWAHSRPYRGM